jgi:lactoylglutathione lyase
MFQKVDCVRIHVPDLHSALDFYQGRLGLELVWRRGDSEAGLKMKDSDTELVLVLEKLGRPEVDITVKSVDKDVAEFEREGGRIIVAPFDIPIGKCAVVQDPWNNEFVLLDTSKGLLKTDSERNVVGHSPL